MKNTKILLLLFAGLLFTFIACDEGGGGGGGGAMSPGMNKISRRISSRGKNYGRRILRKKVKRWIRTRPSDKLEDQLLKDEWEIIGFEPAWTLLEKNKPFESHYYNLLSSLVVGGYDLNPRTGKARSKIYKEAPLTSGVVPQAREKNDILKVLYAVSHYGDFGIDMLQRKKYFERFFNDEEVQGVMLEEVNMMVDTLDANGIFLDFQNIPATSIYAYIDFVKLARAKGRERFGEDYLVYLRLPTAEREQFFSDSTLLELSELTDYFVIRSYDNYNSLKAGAVAPIVVKDVTHKDTIVANGLGADSLVNYYLNAGLHPKELVVEFPLHGTVWTKKENNFIAEGEANKLPFRDINKIAGKRKTHSTDSSYAYFDDVENGLHYFFEDDVTLQKKFEWIDDKELGGAGLWALGYDKTKNNKESIWHSIASVFSDTPVVLVPAVLTYLSFFLFSSFMYSVVRYWQVRNFLNKKRSYLGYYVAGMIAIALLIFIVAVLLPRGNMRGIRIAGIAMFVFMLFPMLRKYFVSIRRWV